MFRPCLKIVEIISIYSDRLEAEKNLLDALRWISADTHRVVYKLRRTSDFVGLFILNRIEGSLVVIPTYKEEVEKKKQFFLVHCGKAIGHKVFTCGRDCGLFSISTTVHVGMYSISR